MHNRLLVKTRVFKMKIMQDELYCLWLNEKETVDNLFFDCIVTKPIWAIIAAKFMPVSSKMKWRRIVRWLCRKESALAKLGRIVFSAAVYHQALYAG
ncbi:hypothetical protein M5689_003727 [Euphorbia peplus]|nr:hypothetical protein M5689_003727 [Euphorbia peplus]